MRVPWLKGSTTSAPAAGSRKGRGIGYFSRVITPSIVQKVAGTPAVASTTPSNTVTFSQTATIGNTIILVAGFANSDGSTSFNAPSGYTQAVLSADNVTTARASVFYKISDGTETSVTVTASGLAAAGVMGVQMYEVAGLLSASPLDKQSSQSDSTLDTDLDTGSTGTLSQPVEFAVAGMFGGYAVVGTNSFGTFVGATGWTAETQQSIDSTGTDVVMQVWWRATTATTSLQITGTNTNTTRDAGVIATFKGWYTGTPSTGQSSATQLLVANNGTTQHDIYAVDRDTLSSATWTTPGSVVGTGTDLVAMAPGFGKVYMTAPSWSAIMSYNGESSLATVTTAVTPGRCIAVHKNRVWMAGNNTYPGRLYYSDIGFPLNWNNTTNYLDILKDSGEVIEDIAPFEDLLVIGTRTKLFLLAGSGADNFVLKSLPVGGVAPGRTLLPTPYGCLAAGRKTVWLITGENVDPISKPIETDYGMTGSFLTTSFIDNQAYINDDASGVTWVVNFQTGTWRDERLSDANEAPAQLYNHDDMQVFAPRTGTIGSLLNYRTIPGTSRGKDFDTLSEVFSTYTSEIWPMGPEYLITPKHLFLRLRQIGGTTGQTGITITPIYDGTAGTAQTFGPYSAAGVHRERMDLGEYAGIGYVQFQISQTLPSTHASAFSVEEATLGFDVEGVR